MIRDFILRLLRGSAGADWNAVQTRIDFERKNLLLHPDRSPPLIAQQLLVSGEDHRHAHHPGFDLIAICRALWRRVTVGTREGASTIEQQIVRTITGRRQPTVSRKVNEIFLAILVNVHFRKGVLPAVYLSIAYYGWRMNGYRQACQRLGLRSDTLTLEDAAALVARLKYPEARSAPMSRFRQIRGRSKHLLNLYRHHKRDGTYGHLDDQTIQCRSSVIGTTQPVS